MAARQTRVMNNDTTTNPFDFAGSLIATAVRGGLGVLARPVNVRPPHLFELYEFEGCPYCRIVREALTELDMDALIHPCPKGGERFRPKALAIGGKTQFPFFVDPNTGTQMYESGDIIRYLFETYAEGDTPLHWRAVELQKLGSGLAGLSRFGAGVKVRPHAADAPEQPLELYSFESSPFARPVRERLCELEIPYVLRSAGRSTLTDWVPPELRDALRISHEPETVNRRALLTRAGRVSIPYLVDPNTQVELAESARIIEYLMDTYAP